MGTKYEKIYVAIHEAYGITLSPAGYEQVMQLIQNLAVCEHCIRQYNKDNPNVAYNCCLECFLSTRQHLTFHGKIEPDCKKFLFFDQKGYAWTSQPGPGTYEQAEEDRSITLSHWHFPRPIQAQRGTEIINISGRTPSIYGDVRTDTFIIIAFGGFNSDIDIKFVARRNDPTALQINKRKRAHRELLAAARDDYKLVVEWLNSGKRTLPELSQQT